jgi:hypothetical protein
MQRPLFALALLSTLSIPPSMALAQWPHHSVLGALPPPVSTPSDDLAAFLFRIETLIDQPLPEPAPGERLEAFITGPFTVWATAITERFRAIRASAPRVRTDAERAVLRGCLALYSELYVQRIEALFRRIGLSSPETAALIDEERRDALALWRSVQALTEDDPAAIAWREHARYQIALLEAALSAAPVAAVASPRRGTDARPRGTAAVRTPGS